MTTRGLVQRLSRLEGETQPVLSLEERKEKLRKMLASAGIEYNGDFPTIDSPGDPNETRTPAEFLRDFLESMSDEQR